MVFFRFLSCGQIFLHFFDNPSFIVLTESCGQICLYIVILEFLRTFHTLTARSDPRMFSRADVSFILGASDEKDSHAGVSFIFDDPNENDLTSNFSLKYFDGETGRASEDTRYSKHILRFCDERNFCMMSSVSKVLKHASEPV